MRKVVIAGMVGNGLEWYDFALYGYFGPIIGKLFLPAADPYVQLILTYGMFAVGFIPRPIGAVIFGTLGDKFGRKFALTLSILLMALPTACLGLLPTYASIGIAAPILLMCIRLLQGLSLAGQFSGSIAFIVEHAPKGRRGLAGSATVISLCAGMLLGSGMATLLAELLSPQQLEAWGWRLPFLFGVVIAFAGYYIRGHTEESPHYEKARNAGGLSKTPVRDACREHWLPLLRGIGIYMSVTVPFYILTIFMSGYISKILGHPVRDALLVSTLSMILLMLLIPFTAWLTDLYGRKRILMLTAVAYFAAAWPLFALMGQGSFASVLTADLLFTVIVAFYIGAAPAVFVELFPTSVRFTGMSLSYNICAALFGGTAPMVSAWLIEATHLNTTPAFYVMFCSAISFLSFIGYHDRYREDLD